MDNQVVSPTLQPVQPGQSVQPGLTASGGALHVPQLMHSMPPLPPENSLTHAQPHATNGWRWNAMPIAQAAAMTNGATVPHISSMLMREADAWRALLSLHTAAVSIARNLPEESDLTFHEQREATAQREMAYLSSISQLSAACDAIVCEATKIRGLRKAKHQLEVECVGELVRAHSDEVLALGESTARNSALTFTAIASELRGVHQTLKTQLAQCRALLQTIRGLRTANLPPNASIVIGLRNGDGACTLLTTEELLHKLHTQFGQVSEEAIAAILSGTACVAKTRERTFARRTCEREIQNTLVAETAAAAEAPSS